MLYILFAIATCLLTAANTVISYLFQFSRRCRWLIACCPVWYRGQLTRWVWMRTCPRAQRSPYWKLSTATLLRSTRSCFSSAQTADLVWTRSTLTTWPDEWPRPKFSTEKNTTWVTDLMLQSNVLTVNADAAAAAIFVSAVWFSHNKPLFIF